MDDKEKRLSEILNTPRTPEQAQACYEKIQQRLSQEKARKKLVLKRVLACAASLILVCAAVLVPLLLKKDEVRYYDDALISTLSTKDVVESGLGALSIDIPHFDSNSVLSYRTYTPKDDDLFVGAKINFECITDSNYYEGSINLYSKDVELSDDNYLLLNKTILCDGISYKYDLLSMDDDLYNYKAYGEVEGFTIII